MFGKIHFTFSINHAQRNRRWNSGPCWKKVIELGSFAKAAEETHRSQSSVSYNLALLQERLGVALLHPLAAAPTPLQPRGCC